MASIGYVCLGTNDFDRAVAFYDALLATIGGKRLTTTPQGQLYRLEKGAMLMVTRPYDQGTATAGNGTMLAIAVDSVEAVAAFHASALELGGTCEGEPGPRGPWGTFAYVRDLDGNKLAAYHSPR